MVQVQGILFWAILSLLNFGTHKIWGILSERILSQGNYSLGYFFMGIMSWGILSKGAFVIGDYVMEGFVDDPTLFTAF